MKVFNGSQYNQQGCPSSITLTGHDIVEAIKDKWETEYAVTVKAITKTSDGYQIIHSGREIMKYTNFDKFPTTIFMDLVSKIIEVENLLKPEQAVTHG
jgi:hypothetical protein